MDQKRRDTANGWLFAVAAVVIALLLIGWWSDWFGLYGAEMAPGTTTPPNNPG